LKNKDSKGSTFHSNSEYVSVVDGRRRMWGVRSHVARGTEARRATRLTAVAAETCLGQSDAAAGPRRDPAQTQPRQSTLSLK